MRNKVPKKLKAVGAPVSLFPKQRAFARQRAFNAGVSFSRYVQALIEYDLRNDVFAAALTQGISTEPKS